ncbi:MAG: hypothetical protein ACREHV_05765 [Rhizomicrobium sp.]
MAGGVAMPFVGDPVPGAQPLTDTVDGAQVAVPSGAGVAPGVVFVRVVARLSGERVVAPGTVVVAPVVELMPGVVLAAGFVGPLMSGAVVVFGAVRYVPPVVVFPAAAEPLPCAMATQGHPSIPAVTRQATAMAVRRPDRFLVIDASPAFSVCNSIANRPHL